MAALTFLASSRSLFGAAFLLAPEHSSGLINFPFHPNAAHGLRLFGVRDVVVGGLLWSADTPKLKRQALIAGLIIDVIDLISTGVGLWEGTLDNTRAVWTGGAAVFVALGLWGLRDLGLTRQGDKTGKKEL